MSDTGFDLATSCCFPPSHVRLQVRSSSIETVSTEGGGRERERERERERKREREEIYIYTERGRGGGGHRFIIRLSDKERKRACIC